MSRQVVCPRCGQDWLRRVRLIALNMVAVICPECEALWLSEEAVGPATWVDYGTFMKESGRPFPDQKGELEVLDPIVR
jgi:hypothetical protein